MPRLLSLVWKLALSLKVCAWIKIFPIDGVECIWLLAIYKKLHSDLWLATLELCYSSVDRVYPLAFTYNSRRAV